MEEALEIPAGDELRPTRISHRNQKSHSLPYLTNRPNRDAEMVDLETNRIATCNPNFDPLPTIVCHCPFSETTSRRYLCMLRSEPPTNYQEEEEGLFWVSFANVNLSTRSAIGSAIEPDEPCWILTFAFWPKPRSHWYDDENFSSLGSCSKIKTIVYLKYEKSNII